MLVTLSDSGISEALIYFAVIFAAFAVVCTIVLGLGKRLRIISSIFLIILISALIYFVATKITFSEPIDNIDLTIATTLTFLSSPFVIIFTAFCNLIYAIAKFFASESALTNLNDVLTHPAFYLSFQGVLFVLSALIFRPRKKRKAAPSHYDD